jgi:phenylacetate-CoA ligase
VRAAADLALLPTIDKHDLRIAPRGERVSGGVRLERLVEYVTSGSTGEPFDVRRTVREDWSQAWLLWQAWRSLGARLGDRRLRVAAPKAKTAGLLRRISLGARHGLMPRLDCRQDPQTLLGAIRAHRPDVLNGYPSALARIAARAARDPARAPRPRLVITGGEELSPHDRRTIAGGFATAVRDVYSAFELGLIAWECAATGLYHVRDDAVVVEVLEAGDPVAVGEEGDVVGTSLLARAMPFVRYRIGDRAVRGPTPCPCGAPVSTIESLRGRRIDYYTMPDGRLLHHYTIAGPALDRARVRDLVDRYQVVQERCDLFVLRACALVPDAGPAMERFAAELRRLLGPGIELRLEVLPRAAFDRAGKFRVGMSRVTAPA